MRGEQRPGHAGPLAGWEQIAIVALLAIMVGLVVLLTISATPPRDHVRPGSPEPGTTPRATDPARARPGGRSAWRSAPAR
jgi:hypothetical protein